MEVAKWTGLEYLKVLRSVVDPIFCVLCFCVSRVKGVRKVLAPMFKRGGLK